MTNGAGDSIQPDSEHGARQYRRRKICAPNLNDIYKPNPNELSGPSPIYVYTNSAYSDRPRDECKYINSGNLYGNRELRK